MRIDVKKVNGSEYLQYVDPHGHIFHIGPANTYKNWQIAAWLYGSGLDDLMLEVCHKFEAEILKRFPEKKNDLSEWTGAGMNGYVGGDEKFSKKLQRVFDDKAIELMEMRKGIKEQFPNIKTKKDLRETVIYNWKLRHHKVEPPMEIASS